MPCANNPCENNAVCLSEDAQPVCYCVPDYHGAFCELRYDDCESKNAHCANGGTCIDGVNDFTCACAPPFAGPTCADLLGLAPATTSETSVAFVTDPAAPDRSDGASTSWPETTATDPVGTSELPEHRTDEAEAEAAPTTHGALGSVPDEPAETTVANPAIVSTEPSRTAVSLGLTPEIALLTSDATAATAASVSGGITASLTEGRLPTQSFVMPTLELASTVTSNEFTSAIEVTEASVAPTPATGGVSQVDREETTSAETISPVYTHFPSATTPRMTPRPIATPFPMTSRPDTPSRPTRPSYEDSDFATSPTSEAPFTSVTEFHRVTFGSDMDIANAAGGVSPTAAGVVTTTTNADYQTTARPCTPKPCTNATLCLFNASQVRLYFMSLFLGILPSLYNSR